MPEQERTNMRTVVLPTQCLQKEEDVKKEQRGC